MWHVKLILAAAKKRTYQDTSTFIQTSKVCKKGESPDLILAITICTDHLNTYRLHAGSGFLMHDLLCS